PYDKIEINAPFSMTFEVVGWKWVKYVVAVRALKGMTSVLLVRAVGQASCWVEMGKICGGCRSFKGYDFCTSSWGHWSSKGGELREMKSERKMRWMVRDGGRDELRERESSDAV
ncbi:hypothetical protein Tco_0714539, partial [Tanacetum coccineum]